MKTPPSLVERLAERLAVIADKLPLAAEADAGPFVSGVLAGAATFLVFAFVFIVWSLTVSFLVGLIGPGRDDVMLAALVLLGLIILIVWALLTQRVTQRLLGSADRASSAGRAVGFIGTPIALFVVISLGVALFNLIASFLGGR